MIKHNKNRPTKLFVLIVLLFILLPINYSLASPNGWNEELSYTQQIEIPFDTSQEIAIYQPVDLTIVFDNPCWAKNEKEHSIRIGCWDGTEWHELESQIYDLQRLEENMISRCNIIFLIPSFADGTEEYYVSYDDSQTPAPDYQDHVSYEESYYRYEPIPGYPLESEHYEIIDDETKPYMISYKGEFMGYNTCQHVYKMIEGTKKIVPKNAEIFAAFDYKYCYDDGIFDYSSTSQQLISKNVVRDGNLMLEIGIESTSKFNDLKTTATYKYYHNPTSNKRIHAHVVHETLEDISIYSQARTDGAFASLQAGGVKSRSIDELNIGEILPWMHFSDERNLTSEYPLDTDPEHIKEDPDIRVISIHDDVDLGKNPWVSFDEGNSGTAHSLIFNSNNIVKSGSNERDGIQINAFQMDYPHLAGLENNIATVQMGRNSIEPSQNHDLTIPSDFIVEFDAEFFSSETKGFPIIKKESKIFQDLVSIKPETTKDFQRDTKEKPRYDLSVYVHNAQSFPFGSSLSAAVGLNLSYITVELYKENKFIFSENAVKIPLNALEELNKLTLVEKAKSILGIVDIRNVSLFKKAYFSDVEQGTYVVKIYKENSGFSNHREFIGSSIIDIQKDSKIHVSCRSEASININIEDQHGKKVRNAEVFLEYNNQTIASSWTDKNGVTSIKAPVKNKEYNLKIVYNEDIVYSEPVKLSILSSYSPIQKTISINRYDLNLQIIDTWNQPIEIDIQPILTLKNNKDSSSLSFENIDNQFIFRNLTSNTYQLFIKFKTFSINESVKISKNQDLTIEFPAEFPITLHIMDQRGNNLDQTSIVLRKNDKKLRLENCKPKVTSQLPPGEYEITVFNGKKLVGSRTISLLGEKNFDIITNQNPLYPFIALLVAIGLIILSFITMIFTKKKTYFYIVLILCLLFLSLFYPWWEINGKTETIETATKLFFIPQNMITTYQSETIIAGETSYLPAIFQQVITLITVATISSGVLISLKFYLKSKKWFKINYSKIMTLLTIILLIFSLSTFLVALNELSAISVGSIIGSGDLTVSIPGEQKISVMSNWGLGIGFYLYLLAAILFVIPIIYNSVNRYWGRYDL